ncbi:hypothetical protein JOC54_003085 [Alkalihalobacillus xiaoxiensis]|uniref:GmrSD restriction endonucleases N-terminal domain-containing protein n=1 Tax=Shouchella xiaoxiensis TaxID=766895 RepID=A0ABS2SYG9_9BACI|nr:DUF262 domain-containing protein [Shouchella xiaoxiensis]MBM7839805.1 hypothetical protein [Shouchella xiaoxiensis]
MNRATTYSFLGLLTSEEVSRIEIPIIQRDYAQGRTEKKGKRTIQTIRTAFVQRLFAALTDNIELELDFIYGTISNQGVFVPLDGQQRLTTLFLLHWYSSTREGKHAEASVFLKRFSYETRMSSKLFCHMLVQLNKLDFNQASISEVIQNEPTFFLAWKQDPTVQSMLVMLDAIHDTYTVPIYERLSSDCPIRFKFINLDHFHLEDTLYIKMNARGKPLTPFENVKAKLQTYMERCVKTESLTAEFVARFLMKMDNEWTDFVWSLSRNHYHDSYLQLLLAMFVNHVAQHPLHASELASLINDEETPTLDELIALSRQDPTWLHYVETTFDAFSLGKHKQLPETVLDIEKVLLKIAAKEVTYTERLQLLAFSLYSHQPSLSNDSLTQWMRLSRNLTENTLYNTMTDFSNSAKTIAQLSHSIDHIKQYLSKETLSGFYGPQFIQEQRKVTLQLQHSGWSERIEKAEDYPYFLGEIGFLLKFSNAIELNERSTLEEHAHAQERFDFYYERAILIFGPATLRVPRNLFTRALLTIGDYTLRQGRNRSFLTEGFDRDISFKRLLREENNQFVKTLIEQINQQAVEASLHTIIHQGNVTDWRRYFIHYPRILEETCGRKRFIRFADENNILLLRHTATSGTCQEYYSFALYAALKEKDIDCSYIGSAGRSGYKYVYFPKSEWQIYFEENAFKWFHDDYGYYDEEGLATLEDMVADVLAYEKSLAASL